jgi:hypothetical protein
MSGFSAADEVFLVGAQWIVVVDSIEYSEDSMRHHRCVFSLVCAFASDTLPWQESIVCRGLTTTQDSLFRQSFYSSRTPSATTRHSKWKPYIQEARENSTKIVPTPLLHPNTCTKWKTSSRTADKRARLRYICIYISRRLVFFQCIYPVTTAESTISFIPPAPRFEPRAPCPSNQASINLQYQSASQRISPHK